MSHGDTGREMKKSNMELFLLCCIFLPLMFSESASPSLQQSQKKDVVSSLVRFKHSSIEKDPSGYLANWSITSSLSSTPCAWNGIICSTDGQVTALNFTDAGLTGHLHIDDIKSLENLKHLYLGGPVPAEIGNCKNLKTVDLSFNYLNGSIPAEIWALPNLTELVIWANHLSDEIPDNFCDKGSNLETLILNNNLITGTIPSSLGNNSLTGEIPPELGKCRSLTWLELNNNNFSGSIPPALSEQSGLITLSLSFSSLFYSFRNEFRNEGRGCREAVGLISSGGVLPKRLAEVYTYSSSRDLFTVIRNLTLNNGSMIRLDLSSNSLSGKIPEGFGSMNYLQFLSLGYNRLTGSIPYSFGELAQIGILDLSHNELEGPVPGSLGMLSFLSQLDVSNNHLSGSISSSGQMLTFPAWGFENNSGLCEGPLPPCSSDTGKSFLRPPEEENSSFIEGGFLISEVGFIVGLIGFCYVLWFKKSWRITIFQAIEEMTENLTSLFWK
ncbi:hypothetical protein C5167_001486 [Papaver somniferum]|uniref:Leucine-rich repeat-containing N-terminal plant-type domain-containing protein n=1 Tax=Papaver somniferum TaxID=3469 RepID=A0A4Y7KY48_PAPSO|nr:hypothetical protein C5167_001486 [Papaver somniferum]